MPRIRTEELIHKIETGDYKNVILREVSSGRLCMLVEDEHDVYIHENRDGTMKEYPRVRHALSWLEKIMDVEKVLIDRKRK